MKTLLEIYENLDVLKEDFDSDKIFRNEADKAYNELISFIKLTKDSGKDLKDVLAFTGKTQYALNFGDINSKYKNLYILFSVKVGGYLGGLGFLNGIPIIILPVMIDTHNFDYLETRINKQVFIHEFIHYLDWKRSKVIHNTANKIKRVSDDIIDLSDYVNSPAEYNAHYQEMLSSLDNTLKNLENYIKMGAAKNTIIDKFVGTNFSEFKNIAMNILPDYFRDNINKTYETKLTKRLYGYWKEEVVPVLRSITNIPVN